MLWESVLNCLYRATQLATHAQEESNRANEIIGQAIGIIEAHDSNTDNTNQKNTILPDPRFRRKHTPTEKQIDYHAEKSILLTPEIRRRLLRTVKPPKKEEQTLLIDMKGVSISSKPRADGRYQGYFNGPEGKLYFYGHSRKEVEQKIQKAIKSGIKVKKPSKKDLTLKAWIMQWFEVYKTPNIKITTHQSYLNDIKHINANKISDKLLRNLTSEDLQRYLLSIQSTHERSDIKALLSQVLRKAYNLGMIKRNPYLGLEIKKHVKKHVESLTRSQQSLFLQAIQGDPDEYIFLFQLGTGLRIGELLALTWDDIDSVNHTVNVNKNLGIVGSKEVPQSSPKTAAGYRTVPILSFAWDHLPPRSTGTERVFHKSYIALQRKLARYSKQLGFHCTTHILRHTYNTRLEEVKTPTLLKMYLMGHDDEGTNSKTYTDIHLDYVLENRELLESAFVFDTKKD